MKLEIKTKYEVSIKKVIEKALTIDNLEEYLRGWKKEYSDISEFNLSLLKSLIEDYTYDISEYEGYDIYSSKDDIDNINESNTNVTILNIDELVEHFKYLID